MKNIPISRLHNIEYCTTVSQAESLICQKCPYPEPICGAYGCAHYKELKSKIKPKRRKRVFSGNTAKV